MQLIDLCIKKKEMLGHITLLVIFLSFALGFILSPFEIHFEDGEEIEW